MEIFEQPIEYVVSAVPLEWPAARHFSAKIKYLRPGEWFVERLGEFLTDAGEWTYTRSERAVFELEEAFEFARTAVPHLTVNGYTVADALEKGPEWR